MSYEIYYRFVTFQDKDQLYVFSLNGSNNDYFVKHNGTQIRSRDWHFFFRGSREELQDYLKKIDEHNEGFMVTGTKSITQEALFKRLTKETLPLEEFKTVFSRRCNLHLYGKEGRELENVKAELDNFTQDGYFNQNAKEEYLGLMDLSHSAFLGKL